MPEAYITQVSREKNDGVCLAFALFLILGLLASHFVIVGVHITIGRLS